MSAKVIHLADVKLAASTSFREAEVTWLDTLLATLRRGGDVRRLASRPEAASIAAKVPAMRAQVERNRARRESAK